MSASLTGAATPLHWGLVPDSVTAFDQPTPLYWAQLCSLPRATLSQGTKMDRQWQKKAWSYSLPHQPFSQREGNKNGVLLGCTHLLLLLKPPVHPRHAHIAQSSALPLCPFPASRTLLEKMTSSISSETTLGN